jgi:hypothetical protein
MADRCPNCGGFDTEKLGKEKDSCLIWVIALIGLPMLVGCCMFFDSISSGELDWQYLIMAIIALFFIVIIVRMFGTDPSLMKCNLCNYRWDSSKS